MNDNKSLVFVVLAVAVLITVVVIVAWYNSPEQQAYRTANQWAREAQDYLESHFMLGYRHPEIAIH